MASPSQVKHYLALWFQVGQKAVNPQGQPKDQLEFCPQPVFQGHQYTPQFEQAWAAISQYPADFHLEGVSIAIADLLSNTWEIVPCCNCLMPVPASVLGSEAQPCHCHALNTWPNTDLPMPRLPVKDSPHLNNLCQRLRQSSSQAESVSSPLASTSAPP